MNRENLQRMADHIRTVSQKKFSMDYFRIAHLELPQNMIKNEPQECGSVGCVIGHCTVLDKPQNIIRRKDGSIDFVAWSSEFTELHFLSDEWDWCFSGTWYEKDNTPIGASLRIEWLLEHGVPEDWYEQINGEAELCYK